MTCAECRNLLSACEAGELADPQEKQVQEHVKDCAECARLLSAMRAAMDTLVALEDPPPPQRVTLGVLNAPPRRSHAEQADAPEIMTPEELAHFLRLLPDDLEEVIGLIPGFEIAGRLRFRKARVLEWIEAREKQREQSLAYAAFRVG
jgi:predicted anti-sigma-YlaC factor YlaD